MSEELYRIHTKDDYKDVPQELKELPIWLVIAEGSKQPVTATKFDTYGWQNPKNLVTFDRAVECLGRPIRIKVRCVDKQDRRDLRVANLGIVVTKNSRIAAADADTHGRDLNRDFIACFESAGTYVEASASGTGRHAVAFYRGQPLNGTDNPEQGAEIYTRESMLMITGKCVANPGKLADMTETLPEIHRRFVCKNAQKGHRFSGVPTRLKSPAHVDFQKFLIANIQDMLNAIHPDESYEGWIKIGMALKYEGFPWEIFDDWSSRGDLYRGQDETAKKWESFKRSRDGSNQNVVTGLFIVSAARAKGWKHKVDSRLIPDYYTGYDHYETVVRNADGTEKTLQRGWYRMVETKKRDQTVSYLPEVDEPIFGAMFCGRNNLVRVRGRFVNGDNDLIDNDDVRNRILQYIMPLYSQKLALRVTGLFNYIKDQAFISVPEVDWHYIYLADETTLRINGDCTITEYREPAFSLTRIKAKYDPEAKCPKFDKYIHELLKDDDILTVQEFLGYCLIPTTKAQTALFLLGDGGEGKSVIGKVLAYMFGGTALSAGISEIQNNPFVAANLEHKLINIDDDVKTEKLGDAEVIKRVVTAEGPIQVQQKGVQHYEISPYARLLSFGNSAVSSKFDHSTGFYRRSRFIRCKPCTRSEKEKNPHLPDELKDEASGILNWMLSGLIRVVSNNFVLHQSEESKAIMDEIKDDDDNVRVFVADDDWVRVTIEDKDTVTSADLWRVYLNWCQANGETPVKSNTFAKRIKTHIEKLGGEFSKNIVLRNADGSTAGKVRGYKKLQLGNMATLI